MNAMTPLPVADRWFERSQVDETTTLIVEPHVIELMRCDIWHVRGRDHDLLVDTGMGLASVAGELADLIGKPVIAVATHGHDDHIGGHHEFSDVQVHEGTWPSWRL
jgi:glyoxylase-like metal-dependent hydrolase (beta-lactamase superfamily II)